jgi:hypothetical protein
MRLMTRKVVKAPAMKAAVWRLTRDKVSMADAVTVER